MVTRAKGRFINRPSKTGRGTYDKFFVYVPTELARDSNFPIRQGQEVELQIDLEKGALMVQPLEDRKSGKQHSKGKQ